MSHKKDARLIWAKIDSSQMSTFFPDEVDLYFLVFCSVWRKVETENIVVNITHRNADRITSAWTVSEFLFVY